jgi:hypothetical protein
MVCHGAGAFAAGALHNLAAHAHNKVGLMEVFPLVWDALQGLCAKPHPTRAGLGFLRNIAAAAGNAHRLTPCVGFVADMLTQHRGSAEVVDEGWLGVLVVTLRAEASHRATAGSMVCRERTECMIFDPSLGTVSTLASTVGTMHSQPQSGAWPAAHTHIHTQIHAGTHTHRNTHTHT